MASLNMVQLIGYLGKDPEIRYSQGGIPIANLSLATDESYMKDGQKIQQTEWHRLVAFDKLADLCSQYLHKGSQIYAQGSLQTRKWQDQQGQDRFTTEIKVFRIQFLDKKDISGAQGAKRPQGSQPEGREDNFGAADDFDRVPF